MECLILHNEPTGENDLLVTVLTRDGERREALLRSGRSLVSRVRAGTLPFSVSDCTFAPGRHQWVLRNALPVLTFPEFRTTLLGLAAAFVNAACVAVGTREVPDPELYAETTKIYRDLHTALVSREPTLLFIRRTVASWIRILSLLGFTPMFHRCGRCGADSPLAALSVSAGGVVCGPCVRELPDSRALSKSASAELVKRNIPQSRGDVRELVAFLAAFTVWHLPDVQLSVQWGAQVILRSLNARPARLR